MIKNKFRYREITAEEYADLYPKYLKDPGTLLDFAGDITGKKILDLGGGGGRASLKALELGASSCTVVDISKSMTKNIPEPIKVIIRDLSDETHKSILPISNIAICQGAINYWFNSVIVKVIYDSLHNDGLFIFNTFNTRPKEKSSISYEIDGQEYYEQTHCYEDNSILHVQSNDNDFHVNQFWWFSREDYMKALAPYFEVQIETKGKTDIYICKRKSIHQILDDIDNPEN